MYDSGYHWECLQGPGRGIGEKQRKTDKNAISFNMRERVRQRDNRRELKGEGVKYTQEEERNRSQL